MAVTVCIGDSITLGTGSTDPYPSQFGRMTSNTTYNKGVTGNTAAQMLARFSTDVLAYSPNTVIIIGGRNDINTSVAVETTEANLAAMVTAATGAGAKVILCTVLPDSGFDATKNTALGTLNTWIATQAGDDVAIADTYTTFNNSGDLAAAYDSGDGTHPNATGSSKTASLAIKAGQTIDLFADVNFWAAAGAGNASTAENWSKGTAPATDENIIFDDSSVQNCSWDIASTTAVPMSINTCLGYTGTVTQATGIAMGVGAGQLAATGGTFTAKAGKTVTCAGNVTKTAGGTITTDVFELVMTGAGKTITLNEGVVFRALTISGSTTLTVTGTPSCAVGLTVTGTFVNNSTSLTANFGVTYSNTGTINGTGILKYLVKTADKTVDLGVVNCPVLIEARSDSDNNRSVTLTANTALGSTLTVDSAHASYTCTLAHGTNYTLTVTGLTTLSTRGVMTQGTGAWAFNGGFTQSGASSVFTQGGNVTIAGDWAMSDGTLTALETSSVTLTGSVNQSAGTVTTNKLCLVSTGAGKTLAFATTNNLYKLTVNGTAQATTGINVSNTLATAAAGILNIATTKTITLTDGTITNLGMIDGLGTLNYVRSASAASPVFGNIYCPMTITLANAAAAGRIVTPATDTIFGSTLGISSADDDQTCTLDPAGKNLTFIGKVTVGTRGVLLGGEGVHHFSGDFDSSAGTWTPETSQCIFTRNATIKLAAEQTFYDLIIVPSTVTTLASDVTVSNVYGLGGSLVPGAFTLTASSVTYTPTDIPVNLKPVINPVLSAGGKRFLRRLERVQ
jgi:lysophospholipase L1-like esterase